MALTTNIRLGWNNLPRTNTLGYHEHFKITGINVFLQECLSVSEQFGESLFNHLLDQNLSEALFTHLLMITLQALLTIITYDRHLQSQS